MRTQIKKMATKVSATILIAASVVSSATPVVVRADVIDSQTTEYVEVVEISNEGEICEIYEGSVSEVTVIEEQPVIDTIVECQGDIIEDVFVAAECRDDVIDDEFVAALSEVPEQMNSVTTEETPTETSSVFCSSERLDEIAAMEISDPAIRAKRDRAVEADRSIFCAGLLKRYYLEKGPGKTFVLGIYFIPSPFVYEIVEKIEEEIENGDRSYIYNGQFYASPEEDPTFNKSLR